MSTSTASYWHKFFISAGIPPQSASAYAASFSQNRITSDMLPDLNKDYLKDLGVKLLGDVIAILKHAQKIQNEKAQKKAFEKPKASSKKLPVSKQTSADVNNVVQQTPSNRTPSVDRHLTVEVGNDRAERERIENQRVVDFLQTFGEEPPSLSGSASNIVADDDFIGRRPDEGTIIQQLSKPCAEKTRGKNDAKAYYSTPNPGSVFRRLGKRAEDTSPSNGGKESVFSRIGQRDILEESKRLADSIVLSTTKPVLQVRPKVTTISAGVLSPSSVRPPSGNITSNGILSPFGATPKSLTERLGKKVEDKTADQRLPINALAIAKFLK